MAHRNAPDLMHRDWLNNAIITLFQKVNNNIRYTILNKSGNRKLVKFWNINEVDLPKLPLLTNTDGNNNYGYLDKFEVYTDNKMEYKIEVPGLNTIILRNSRDADIAAFLNGDKLFYPFVPFLNGPNSNKLSIPKFIDQITEETPWLPNTTGKGKQFMVTFNPDCIDAGTASNCSECCPGVICSADGSGVSCDVV